MALRECTDDRGPDAAADAVRPLRYEVSRRDRLYLARRRLLDAGYSATVTGPVPGGSTLLVLRVERPSSRDDLDRVTRIVRGTDPESRRV